MGIHLSTVLIGMVSGIIGGLVASVIPVRRPIMLIPRFLAGIAVSIIVTFVILIVTSS